ncbi:MAG: hypothetical protein HKO75_10245 [Flavobacteriaceae bacterium]|nr:hypothetical protein [Muriicola sp.]MBT8289492.1 hypothetical protein [Muriicola sp.]NNC62873.1 hypothetical protein [Eudoraea sp.]NNK34684.1 hypothetical protein [Eudoraea sp.]NNL40228.1 hypothetical protein [Flavobacteriaceae bacterium]
MKRKIEDWNREFWGRKKSKISLLEKINSQKDEQLFIGASFCGDIRKTMGKSENSLINNEII